MEPIIKAEGLTRVFKTSGDPVYALRGVSFDIMPGTFTILQGPSGSGKTTLINLLGALDKPNGGEVFFDGENLGKLSETATDNLRRTKMGFVFQSVALISLMSAYENVEFGLRISGCDRKTQRKRALECLDYVGLGKRVNHRPGELSGGEQQRVAIARAIAHDPLVIFADEPTAELDTHMALQVVKIFKSLVETHKVTIIMSSHDPNIQELADHLIELEDGELKYAR